MDEVIFPAPEYAHMTIPDLLQMLDRNFAVLPDSYKFKRVFFPDEEDKNTEM